jgi:RHS repeat-associated protein
VNGGASETTDYIGRLLEKVTTGGVSDFRHYIFAGNRPVAVYSRKSSGTNGITYLLLDHQGSIETLASSTGTTVANESFTVFGSRRNAATWTGAPSDRATLDGVTRQGYTFQTVLGSIGLNHMNGRVQDSVTGRFLSADPYITSPTEAQAHNRYSYVLSNPLTLVDPTGFAPEDASPTVVVVGCPWGMIQGKTRTGRVTCTDPRWNTGGYNHTNLFYQPTMEERVLQWIYSRHDRHAALVQLANSGEGGKSPPQTPKLLNTFQSCKNSANSKLFSDSRYIDRVNTMMNASLEYPIVPGNNWGTAEYGFISDAATGQIGPLFTSGLPNGIFPRDFLLPNGAHVPLQRANLPNLVFTHAHPNNKGSRINGGDRASAAYFGWTIVMVNKDFEMDCSDAGK